MKYEISLNTDCLAIWFGKNHLQIKLVNKKIKLRFYDKENTQIAYNFYFEKWFFGLTV